jgi:hypothetical protein
MKFIFVLVMSCGSQWKTIALAISQYDAIEDFLNQQGQT